MSRNAHTPCDYDGCTVTPQDEALFRVNPKGEIGVFMCAAHARIANRPPHEPRQVAAPSAPQEDQ